MASSVILTLDGATGAHDWTVSGHAMRWLPPEQVEEIRAERRRLEDECRQQRAEAKGDRT